MAAPLLTLKKQKNKIIFGSIERLYILIHGMVSKNFLNNVLGLTNIWFPPIPNTIFIEKTNVLLDSVV